MYKISIIIPVYNVEKYIDNTFKSIYNQTIGFENLEVIFIDDCSSDQSKIKIREYENKYENVKGHYLDENSGFAGKPRNIGIEKASAEYIMFLDSDDYLTENACEILYKKITTEDIDLASGNFSIQRKDNLIPWDYVEITDSITINDINEKPSLLILPPSIWTKIYKKEFLLKNNIRFNENLPGQDALFIYSVLTKAKGISFANKELVIYNKREDDSSNKSVTGTFTFERLHEFLEVYDKMYEVLKKYDTEYVICLNSHLSYWTSLFEKTDLSTNERVNLVKYYKELFNRINKHKTGNSELLKIITPILSKNLIKFLNTYCNITENETFNYYDVIKNYQKKITKLNDELYLEKNSENIQNINKPKKISHNSIVFDKKVKISVIIPIYNVEKYLHNCINSVLNQTFTDFEIICINDNSTDSSPAILNYFAKKDDRVKIINNTENLGPGACRNIGINYSNGEYIQFLDSDDWLDENSLEKLYDAATKYDSEVIIFKLINYDYRKDEFYKSEYYSMDNLNINYDKSLTYKEIGNDVIFNIPNSPCNKFLKSSFIKKNSIYFPEEVIYEDNPFFFEIMYESNSILFLNEYLYNRSRREYSITNCTDSNLLNIITISEIVLNYFKNSGLYESCKDNVLNYIISIIIKKYYMIDREYKEEYYRNMKNKISEYETKYMLKEDFEKYLNQLNKRNYHLMMNTEDYEDFAKRI